jgi:cytochrome c peroxidase
MLPTRRCRGLAAACGAALLAAGAASAAPAGGASGAEGPLRWSRAEVALIVQHGPWPPPARRDPSNRVSGQSAAIDFGARLFFDPRLSTTGTISCASCHIPEFGWTDRRPRAIGLDQADRNTQSVVNARLNRWFGWAGATDSLWAASIRPLADPREMGSAERHVTALVRADADLACRYRRAFGRAPPDDEDLLLADLGKALAAFQETLATGRTPFDEFRDALARGERAALARYPAAAQRGLRLFIGKAGCNVCHFGANFTNGEFDKIGIDVRTPGGRYDWGRYDGIKALRANRFNLLTRFNDDPRRAGATGTRHVALSLEAYGAFRVPSLRNVALTAPYMHGGQLATLREVVRHYSEIDPIRLHLAVPHPHVEPGEELPARPVESPLRTLGLSAREIDDLVAFLETLSERRPLARRPAPDARACR